MGGCVGAGVSEGVVESGKEFEPDWESVWETEVVKLPESLNVNINDPDVETDNDDCAVVCEPDNDSDPDSEVEAKSSEPDVEGTVLLASVAELVAELESVVVAVSVPVTLEDPDVLDGPGLGRNWFVPEPVLVEDVEAAPDEEATLSGPVVVGSAVSLLRVVDTVVPVVVCSERLAVTIVGLSPSPSPSPEDVAAEEDEA